MKPFFPKVLERLKSAPVEDARFDRLDKLIIELRPTILANAILPFGVKEYATLCGQQYIKKQKATVRHSLKDTKAEKTSISKETLVTKETSVTEKTPATAKTPMTKEAPMTKETPVTKETPISKETTAPKTEHNLNDTLKVEKIINRNQDIASWTDSVKGSEEHLVSAYEKDKPVLTTLAEKHSLDSDQEPNKRHKPDETSPLKTKAINSTLETLTLSNAGIQDVKSPETFDFETFARKVKQKSSKDPNTEVLGFYFCFSCICYTSRLAQIDSRYAHTDGKSAAKCKRDMENLYLAIMPMIDDAKLRLRKYKEKKGEPMRALLYFPFTQSSMYHCGGT
jgi:hypothetical protein